MRYYLGDNGSSYAAEEDAVREVAAVPGKVGLVRSSFPHYVPVSLLPQIYIPAKISAYAARYASSASSAPALVSRETPVDVPKGYVSIVETKYPEQFELLTPQAQQEIRRQEVYWRKREAMHPEAYKTMPAYMRAKRVEYLTQLKSPGKRLLYNYYLKHLENKGKDFVDADLFRHINKLEQTLVSRYGVDFAHTLTINLFRLAVKKYLEDKSRESQSIFGGVSVDVPTGISYEQINAVQKPNFYDLYMIQKLSKEPFEFQDYPEVIPEKLKEALPKDWTPGDWRRVESA